MYAGSNSSDPVLLTIGTCNRRAGIAVVAESFLKHHPTGRVYVCLVDRPHSQMPPVNLEATTFFADEMALPGGRRFLFKYDAFELCCALKPFAIQHVFHHYGVPRMIYLDSDILVTHSFWPDLEEAWKSNAIILTPHLLQLPSVLPFDVQRSLVQHGGYNGGFLAVEKSHRSFEFLSWWSNMLKQGCTFDPMNSIYVDQRWLDLAAASSGAVGILRDPGMNVAYWNLHERALQRSGAGSWTVNGKPLKFFHFSGYDCKTLTNKAICTDTNAIALAEQYNQLLCGAENERFKHFCYGWDFYSDGTKILPPHRDLILADHPDLIDIIDPFISPSIEGKRRNLERLSRSCLPIRISQRYQEAAKDTLLLRRLHQHRFLGAVWKLWARFIDPSLRPHFYPDVRS
jgi:hypothetical protein